MKRVLKTIILAAIISTLMANVAFAGNFMWIGDSKIVRSPRTGRTIRLFVTSYVYRYYSRYYRTRRYKVYHMYARYRTNGNVVYGAMHNALWNKIAWYRPWRLLWDSPVRSRTARDSGWIYTGSPMKTVNDRNRTGLRTYYTFSDGGAAWRTEVGKDF